MNVRELKAYFKKKASEEYKKFFAVETLGRRGYTRHRCVRCGKFFWSAVERAVCGEPECSGGYTFIGNPIAKQIDYIGVWREFAEMFAKFGYTPIKRYPVVARWRDDTDFVQASIYDFQPHVVSGAVEPPANPLVVPQFCLRFVDIDNVGVTGRHLTSFVMIGQHAFVPPERFDINLYLEHICEWLFVGLRIPKEEVVFHEDGWAGGGNGGNCMEFFSRGCELGNQVYMHYSVGETLEELRLKVLDMGTGQERYAWFSSGLPNTYEPVMPTVCRKLFSQTGFSPDRKSFEQFLPYSGLLNVEEANVEEVWRDIALKIGEDVDELKKVVYPLAAIYSIADHTRGLLFALNDGALPSNVGGGYNLRVLARRCFSLAERYGWDIDIFSLFEEHARYLSPQYPELQDNISDIKNIISDEMEKYRKTRERARSIVENLITKQKLDEEKLVEIYDSHGVTPDMVEEVSRRLNKRIHIPEDFYARVTARHEKTTKKAQAAEPYEVPDTEILYYDDVFDFDAEVLYVSGERVILDRTAFFPESGGQSYDAGFIDTHEVHRVEKVGGVIIHFVAHHAFKIGQHVSCSINKERRLQLARHHTATHIINGVCRQLLGNHIWQAGAEKTIEKARLDITHYKSLTKRELGEIEREANRIVLEGRKVDRFFLERNEAEKRYGFRLYQGGVVPGKVLHIVDITGLDVEACGGTHLDNTAKCGSIRILSAEKIQDGVVRLEYVAGLRAVEENLSQKGIIDTVSETFSVGEGQIVKTAERFFSEWKERGKEIETLQKRISEMNASMLSGKFVQKEGLRFLDVRLEGTLEEIRATALTLVAEDAVIVLSNGGNLVVACGRKAQEKGYKAHEYIKKFGKGGGTADLAQGVVK